MTIVPIFKLKTLKGLIDIAAEIAKCEKKLDLARLNLDKIRKIQSQAEYEETIPANVRLLNEDKVCVGKHMPFFTILTPASLIREKYTRQKLLRLSCPRRCLLS